MQGEEQDGCREALRGNGYVTPQELMGGKQEPLALCGSPGQKRLWHVNSTFPAPCRVLRQQAALPEPSGLQWSLLAAPLAFPGGQSWAREAAVLPQGFAQLPGVRPALRSCTVWVVTLWCAHPATTQIVPQHEQEAGTSPVQAVQCECAGT